MNRNIRKNTIFARLTAIVLVTSFMLGLLPPGNFSSIFAVRASAEDGEPVSQEPDAAGIEVTFNLGYAVEEGITNDDSIPAYDTTPLTLNEGDTVTLGTPARFGYTFAGWKKGSNIISGNSYTLTAEDAESGSVEFNATWAAQYYYVSLLLPAAVPVPSVEISVDNGNTWQDVTAFCASNSAVTLEGATIIFSEYINFGEQLGDYLHRVGMIQSASYLPLVRDTRDEQRFGGWTTSIGAPASSSSAFSLESGGFLNNTNGLTLQAFNASLHTAPTPLNAFWGERTFMLTVNGSMSGWQAVINGEPVSVSSPVQVLMGSTVSWRTERLSPSIITYWAFTYGTGNYPTITEDAQSGYIYYNFTMPAADVTATLHTEPVYIDISRSPIVFDEDVSYNGRSLNGFYYKTRVPEYTPLFYDDNYDLSEGSSITGSTGSSVETSGAYFYIWDSSKSFYITSNGLSTTNQLVLVNAQTVYFRDVWLAPQENYINNAHGATLNGYDIFCHLNMGLITAANFRAAVPDLASYGNIVLSERLHPSYTENLYFTGEGNKVMMITSDVLVLDATHRKNLYIRGAGNADNCELSTGLLFMTAYYYFQNISIHRYANDGVDMKWLAICCRSNNGIGINNSVIDTPAKTMITDGSTSISGASRVDVDTIVSYSTINVSSTSYLRVRGNLYGGFTASLTLSGSASAVIDGSLYTSYWHWNASAPSSSTSGYLIVKGSTCDLGIARWGGTGTLIANNVTLSYRSGITKGTVITNTIANGIGYTSTTYSRATHTFGRSNQSGYTMFTNQNGDDYPFVTVSDSNSLVTNYTFSGGDIYLFGDYSAFEGGAATDEGNPVKDILESMLDENGDLDTTKTVDMEQVRAKAQDPAYKDHECFMLGNSTHCTGVRYKSFIFSGSNIYAVGNITTYNDTTVSKGNIVCGGNFSSKHDLTITGGTITANAVGNAYNLRTTDEDGTSRWKTTTIAGGTINADMIGAMPSFAGDASVTPRSTVIVTRPSSVKGTPEIVHDEFINYIYDANLFTLPANPNNVRMTGTWDASYSAIADMTWTTVQAVSFSAPVIITGGTGVWKYDELTGPDVDAINAQALPTNGGSPIAADNAYSRTPSAENGNSDIRDRINLYAVKNAYLVILEADDENHYTIITYDGNTGSTEFENDEKEVPATKTVILNLDDAEWAEDYCVLWYVDGNGAYHNVLPSLVSGNMITFEMPYADVHVFITKTMTLDFEAMSLTLDSDGFFVEYDQTRNDSEFHYLGNLVIEQPGAETKRVVTSQSPVQFTNSGQMRSYNRIKIKSDFDNSTNGRTITLQNLIQGYLDETTPYTLIEAGANINFSINGNVALSRIYVRENSNLTFTGVSGHEQDGFYCYGSTDYGVFGNPNGKCGNITFDNLRILTKENQRNPFRWGYSSVKGDTVITYRNCYMVATQWYSSSALAYSAAKVVIDHSEMRFSVNHTWPDAIASCTDFDVINGSYIEWLNVGAANSPTHTFNGGITGTYRIADSTFITSLYEHNAASTTYMNGFSTVSSKLLVIEGDSSVTLEKRSFLNNIIVNGGMLNVGDGTGHLECQEITVNGGTVNAGQIVVAGFGDWRNTSPQPLYADEFYNYMAQGRYIFDGSSYNGFTLNGGTVNISDFIGGDVNAKITVNGGTLNALNAGTAGKLYGVTRRVPRTSEPFFFTYERIPVGAAITVNGGTVNILENGYLGGMKSAVVINGGNVNLADGAVLGTTDAQVSALLLDAAGHHIDNPSGFSSILISDGTVTGAGTGSTNSDYGTIVIDGPDVAVNVWDMSAVSGTVTISQANGANYPNSYTGTDRVHSSVGVNVRNEMYTQSVVIDDCAVVYVNYLIADVANGKDGGIVVEKADNNDDSAFLYLGNYGAVGDGVIVRDYCEVTDDNFMKNIFGIKVVNITYIINPDGVMIPSDVSEVVNQNIPYFGSTGWSEIVLLEDPTCLGYYFDGWYETYENGEFSNPATQIDKMNRADLVLYAKWERVSVPFTVYIDMAGRESDVDENTMTRVGDSTLYRFNLTPSSVYGKALLYNATDYSSILEGGVLLSDFRTGADATVEVGIEDEYFRNGSIYYVTSVTQITKDLVQAYLNKKAVDPDATISLVVVETNQRLVEIILNINMMNGLPHGAAFNNENNPQFTSFPTISSYVEINRYMRNGQGFMNGSEFIGGEAVGYTFLGWSYTPSWDESNVIPNVADLSINDMSASDHTTLYGVWKANVYTVRFSAGPGSEYKWVTNENTEPAAMNLVTNPEVPYLDYKWTYDTVISNGALNETFGEGTEWYSYLPVAWKEGFVFEGWEIEDSEYQITENSLLSVYGTNGMPAALFDMSAGENDVALTVAAKYRKASVTYNPKGGRWTDANTEETQYPAYFTPLAGYTALVSAPAGGRFVAASEALDEYGNAYHAVSTTGAYFDANSAYIAEDFRYVLSLKGYTFSGWNTKADGSGDIVGSAPRFNDISVYAVWDANDYNVVINGIYTGDTYTSDFSSDAESSTGFGPSVLIPVRVGQEINVANWPSTNGTWFAIDDNSSPTTNTKRYFLGATFAPMDPGLNGAINAADKNDEYVGYAEAVVNMLHVNASHNPTMFSNRSGVMSGSMFYLPEDDVYTADISTAYRNGTLIGSFSVPDYPAGSTIPLYGIYRERSIVFIEQYTDDEGHVENIRYNVSYREFNDYPADYELLPYRAEIESRGFSLQGWYVNAPVINASTLYPSTAAAYAARINDWLSEAEQIGTYDVMVYTVYVARVVRDIVLESDENPVTANASPVITKTFVLPGSMQSGYIRYALDNASGLNLISKGSMLDRVGDDTISDDTVTIVITIDGTEFDLADYASGMITDRTVGIGDEITVTFYHSKVICNNEEYKHEETAPFEIEFSFSDDPSFASADNTLEYQSIVFDFDVILNPSVYTVVYNAIFPENYAAGSSDNTLNVLNGNGFTLPSEGGTFSLKTVQDVYYRDYKSTASCVPPVIEGYEYDSEWSPFSVNTSNGIISAYLYYNPLLYNLSADEGTLDRWIITYTDGINNAVISTLDDSEDIKYHSTVRILPNPAYAPGADNYDGPSFPEFITVNVSNGESYRLDCGEFVTADGAGYVLTMPAFDVEGVYSRVKTLYLDDGTIDLLNIDGRTGYIHHDRYYVDDVASFVVWRGDYEILQDKYNNDESSEGTPDGYAHHSTPNVLNITGNISDTGSDQDVNLGNLWITSNNSINLIVPEGSDSLVTAADISVERRDGTASELRVRNIAVPEYSQLDISSANNSDVILTPAANYAGIGGTVASPASGAINVDKLDINLTLNAPSHASGIGQGYTDETCGAVTVTNSNISVSEHSSAGDQYHGAWIGGAAVPSVTVNGVTVSRNSDSNIQFGSKVIDGQNVTITDSAFGTYGNPLTDPVHAADNLNITNSSIYLTNEFALGSSSMIGTDDSDVTEHSVNVVNSTINIAYTTGSSDSLYTGVLHIRDSASDVVISGTQIVDVSNGNIEVINSGVRQDTDTHIHGEITGLNYLILEENGRGSYTAPNLTVTGISDNSTITVGIPNMFVSNTDVLINNLAVADDVVIVLKGDLEVSGTASTTASADITVTSDNGNITFTGTTPFSNCVSGSSYTQNGGNLTSDDSFGCANLDVNLYGVTADVKDLYADDMYLENSSVSAEGEVGSLGRSGEVTHVTLVDSDVEADTLGALHQQARYSGSTVVNDYFTAVSIDSTSAYNAVLVEDCYRLTYNTFGVVFDLTGLSAVLRTVTENGTVTVYDAVPASLSAPFVCWYIYGTNGTDMLQLTDGTTPATGLNGVTLLAKNTESSEMTAPAADGTKTLTVFAFFHIGTAVIKNGRLFSAFENGLTSVIVPENAAWTVLFESVGAKVNGRDYKVDFTQTIPEGTKLTLTVPQDGTSTYYYYIVPSGGINTVSFSDFILMGATSTALSGLANTGNSERFLLSADFSSADVVLDTIGYVSFSLQIDEEYYNLVDRTVSYRFSDVDLALLTAASDKVTIAAVPSGDTALTEKSVYLIAEIAGPTVPADASMTAGGITGTRISSNRFAFALPAYSALTTGEYPVTVSGFDNGDYTVSWTLCYRPDADIKNLNNLVVSNTATATITVNNMRPYLTAVNTLIDGSAPASIVLDASASHTLTFAFATNAEQVSVSLEKQTLLARFTDSGVEITQPAADLETGTVTVTIPASSGTYRVRFSINGSTSNDDAFFSFIVK